MKQFTNGPQQRPPLFMLLFMSIFGFIGIAVLIFLWSADGFGAPPLIFRVFGSFIALGFIFMGFGAPISMLLRGKDAGLGSGHGRIEHRIRKPGSYDCPNCGGNVGKADVSPSGDIKCQYCNEWWNIHA